MNFFYNMINTLVYKALFVIIDLFVVIACALKCGHRTMLQKWIMDQGPRSLCLRYLKHSSLIEKIAKI